MSRSTVEGASCVQGREDEVAGLGGGQRGPDRLEVAHLAQQDYVGVLPERAAQRLGEARRVGPDLALVDDAALVPVGGTRSWSSMVMMWSLRVRLISSITAASVVDLPEPVGPVTRTRPRGFVVKSLMTGGSPSCSIVFSSAGDQGGSAAPRLSRWK